MFLHDLTFLPTSYHEDLKKNVSTRGTHKAREIPRQTPRVKVSAKLS